MKGFIYLSLMLLLILAPKAQAVYHSTEFRGMWVVTWEIFKTGKKSKQILHGEQLKQRIVSILDNIKKAGLNAVIWQVRQNGEAYYPSSFEPWGQHLGRVSPGFDPLDFAITEAHKRGLEFHAWANTFESRTKVKGTPAFKFPEWVCTNAKGESMPSAYTLSPGIKEARDYLVKVISEIARKYPVDGIHLDYVRWSEFPMGEPGYPASSPQYQFDGQHLPANGIPTGFKTWADWRRDGVTQFIKALRAELNSIRPGILLSPAAIGKYNWGYWNGRDIVFQDAALWLNTGLVDQIMGMNYSNKNYQQMYDALSGNCPKCWFQYLQPNAQGIKSFSAGVGSLMLRNAGDWQQHVDIVKAIRDAAWPVGMQFFSYEDWEKKNYFEKARKELFDGDIPAPR